MLSRDFNQSNLEALGNANFVVIAYLSHDCVGIVVVPVMGLRPSDLQQLEFPFQVPEEPYQIVMWKIRPLHFPSPLRQVLVGVKEMPMFLREDIKLEVVGHNT